MNDAPVLPSQPTTTDLNDPRLWDRIRKLEHDNNQAAARIQELEEFVGFWSYEGRLQTYEDRQRFRKAAAALSAEVGKP